jgi:hypothetical protein
MPFRSDLPPYAAPHVHASLKELSVLPARIFTTMLLPPGAIGTAAEAVEFLEMSGQNGLARLDVDKTVSPELWRAPRITREGVSRALCDGRGTSAFFYAGALADWLAAIAHAGEKGTIAIAGGAHADWLTAVPYWLARRGHSAAVVQIDDTGGVAAAVAIARGGEWRYDLVAGDEIPADDDIGLDELSGWPSLERTGHRARITRSIAIVEPRAPAGPGWRPLLTSESLARTRQHVLRHGWPVERELWERLMTFADKSLIPSSEQSRLGAGYAKGGLVE